MIKVTFEVEVNKDFLIDDETLKGEYYNDIQAVVEYLFKEEGIDMFLHEQFKLVKVEDLWKA